MNDPKLTPKQLEQLEKIRCYQGMVKRMNRELAKAKKANDSGMVNWYEKRLSFYSDLLLDLVEEMKPWLDQMPN